jgi:amino acid transporter
MAVAVAAPDQQPTLGADGLKRDVGLLGLLWASEGSIIGSGWLFGALLAVQIAGPAAIIAWAVASVIIVVLALVHAELGGMFPVTGGTSRFPHYAFGSFAGANFGWFAYIQAATVAPIEVLATVQYLSVTSWASGWYTPAAPGQLNGTLSRNGIIAAVVLMVFFVIVNLIGIRWLANANTAITTWKVLIPIGTIIILLTTHFHSGNFSAGGGFFASGGAAHTIEEAIASGGIVFSLLGFEQAVQLGGESRSPQRDLPRAVIGSILIGATIYILVQIAFIAALSPAEITQAHTWSALGTLKSQAGLSAAPFYAVASLAGLGWLAGILRADAVISPGGTGLIYLTSTSRIGFGLSRNGYIPQLFEKTDSRTKIPVWGVIISTLIGLIFLLPFPSWATLVTVVTFASVLMYAGAPLALAALRKSKPDLPRSYRLPAAEFIAPASFVLASEILYWTGYQTITTFVIVFAIGYLLMALSRIFHLNDHAPTTIDWRGGYWVPLYFVGMLLIAFFGNFGAGGIVGGVGFFHNKLIGADGFIPNWLDLLTVAGWSLFIYILAINSRLSSEMVDKYVHDVYPPPVH